MRSASSRDSARARSREPRETSRARAKGAVNEHDAAFDAARIANDDIVAHARLCDDRDAWRDKTWLAFITHVSDSACQSGARPFRSRTIFTLQTSYPSALSVSSSSLVPRALRHARPLVRHVREFDLRPTSEQVRASRDPRARLPAPETRPLPRVNTNVFSRQLCLSPLGRTKSDATASAQRAAQGTPRRLTR